ncbi:WecB/TagA/CpsF family glycosyltransferase [Neobacillus citreus]|uniref:N-acetylglucosaminyldiphosphoundecaprenol N-acetyl-beta-D-mannosaminyltransferase n=1 Tax=Neobacillus citreus TaxID=2833578 RepID=A0A942YA64_9BACI|nr:WecB/TagA/CpsF family glycosyltransferase [Neobacillus citreus]MCH6266533.1 WecB/TagA/CpsF family glycosyltransferase [Neobacillus citreus]
MNGKPKIKILHTSFDYKTRNELMKELFNRVNNLKKTFLVTANPEIVYYADKDPFYQQKVNQADYVISDGYGVILASKIIGRKLPERIPGFEVMCDLLSLGNSHGWSAYFLGAKKEVLEKAIFNIKERYPNLKISGFRDGYFTDSTDIRNEIHTNKPDLVFVALGFPKQEEWIVENYSEMEKGLFIGVGGSFDVMAGVVKRAPAFWRNLNLEWFYRLIKQPSRWRRMLVLPAFVLKVIKNKYFS